MELSVKRVREKEVTICWESVPEAESYRVYWADRNTERMEYRLLVETAACEYTLKRSTHIPHYFKVAPMIGREELFVSDVLRTPVGRVFREQLERLERGLVAVPVKNGVFLSWRMFLKEADGCCETGLTGTDFAVYRNGERLAVVTDSTNYLDQGGCREDLYRVAPIREGREGQACRGVKPWDREYLELPIRKPEGGITPAGEAYEYSANDMSVGDVDGDGEYEFFVKWDPSNSHDVSHRGYTGNCYIDCYKLDGTLLWRLDMGVNIRAGAHYTQFMVYDFNGDGRAEMAVKTAPGTRMTIYRADGGAARERYITMPAEDVMVGYTHEDNYVCSAEDYRQHMADVFAGWQNQPEVMNGRWPKTPEECFGRKPVYQYPLSRQDALALADYFIKEYAPSRSPKNELDKFEGFIYEGPEYLTMFGGDGEELQTIWYKPERVDDGLMWGDYAWFRIEPCNRVDRFQAGVAYLDGERPCLIVCRGYYTRTVIVAYDFFENRFRERFTADSEFVPMNNPFDCTANHETDGTNPVYGALAGQGDHSLAAADVDGDGCMEIIYGAAVIDHDGSLLYSSREAGKDGVAVKLGHGDAMHVANIDPDRPGLEIFNVFEGASSVPYGFALRDAETGRVLFGEPADRDLGRCMIGKIDKDVRGYQVWVNEVYDCKGNKLPLKPLSTNMSIRFAGDLTTQLTDGVDYLKGVPSGVVNDHIHGILLEPEGTLTNNGTKGNPCLVADIFGDFREELLLRTQDSSAIRIYMNTELTAHKLFTLMHDAQYRCGVAWQNNCYNQPCYPKFYYGSDMDFKDVLPQLSVKSNC